MWVVKVDLPPRLRWDFPTAVVVVSCSAPGVRPNLIAAGSVGHACIDPPMLGFSVGHSKYSYSVMERADSFVVNIPRADQATIVDYCGSVSGLDVDKYDKLGLSVLQSSKVFSPGIMEFPVNIECVKRRSVELGSHTYYFGEIVAVRCDESVVEGGRIVGSSLDPMCTFLRQYWRLGEPVIGINSTSKAVG